VILDSEPASSLLFSVGMNVTVGLIVVAIIAFFAWTKRKTITAWFGWYRRRAEIRSHLELFYKAGGDNLVVSVLLARIAATTAVHLTEDWEEVTLDEYRDMLFLCIDRNLQPGRDPDPRCELTRCWYVARTNPEDWDPSAQNPYTPKIRGYFDTQRRLAAAAKTAGTGLDVRRYIVLSRDAWDKNTYRNQMIEEHEAEGIKLYYCDPARLPEGFEVRDSAWFIDNVGREWIVESDNFDEDTLRKYSNAGLPPRIRAKIVRDESIILARYGHYFTSIREASTLAFKKEG